MKKAINKIRVGMIRCDVHACWYGLLMASVDESILLKYFPQCHYYFYYRHNLKFEIVPGFELTKIWDGFHPHEGISRIEDEKMTNAEIFAKTFLSKPKICNTPEEVSDGVDLVFIADCMGQGEDHLALAAPGLRKGIPTFIDKPYTYNLADAQAMISLAKANNTPLMSASLLRLSPLTDQFRSRFAEIAPVGEGVVKGVGSSGLGAAIHGLSLAQHVFGGGVEWVDCMGRIPLEIVRLHYPSREGIFRQGVDVVIISSHLIGPHCGFQCVVYGGGG